MELRIFKKVGIWSFVIAATLPFCSCITTAAIALTPIWAAGVLVEHVQHGLGVSTHDHTYHRDYAGGGPKEIGTYKDGRLNGPHTTWYRNGQKKSEGAYKAGKQNGLWKLWHDDGRKQAEVNWKVGKAVSAKFWNRKGEEVNTLQEARK